MREASSFWHGVVLARTILGHSSGPARGWLSGRLSRHGEDGLVDLERWNGVSKYRHLEAERPVHVVLVWGGVWNVCPS